MHERLRTGERGRFTPAASCSPRSPRHAEPGLAGRRAARGRRPRRPGRRPARHRRAPPGADPAQVAAAPRPRRTSTRSWSTARVVVAGGPAPARRRRPLLLDAIAAALGGRMTQHAASPGSPSWSPATRRADRRRARHRSHDAAVVVEDGRVAWVGPAPRAPAADERRRRRRAAPWSPASSTPTPTWSSPATGPPSSPPAWPARRTTAAASRRTVAATRAATDDAAARPAGGAGRRDARAGHDDRRDQERLRAHGRRRGPRAAHRRASVTPETTFLGAHVVPAGVRRPPRRVRRPGHRRRCSRACAPHARWVDVFCEPHSAHAFDERRGAARCSPRAARPGSGCACTATSSAPAPACGWPSSSGAASVDHCTHLTDADVDALVAAAGTTVATLLPGVEFSTRSPYPDARRLLDAGRLGRARDRLQPGHLLLVVDAVL